MSVVWIPFGCVVQTTLFCWFFVCKASSGCVCSMMATMVVLVKVLHHIKFNTSSVSSPLQPTGAPHDCRELSQIWLRFVFGGFRVPFSCQHQHLTWQTLHRLMPRKAKSSPLASLYPALPFNRALPPSGCTGSGVRVSLCAQRVHSPHTNIVLRGPFQSQLISPAAPRWALDGGGVALIQKRRETESP